MPDDQTPGTGRSGSARRSDPAGPSGPGSARGAARRSGPARPSGAGGAGGAGGAAVPLPEHAHLLRALGIIALLSCPVFAISILIADFVVPDHDWIADTISDLGAGRFELIVDVGIYAYSAGLIACAVGAAHAHLGGRGWSWGIYGLILLGLIVFLVGARNEYGDGDNEGPVLHIYLVYALGLLFGAVPWAMSAGAARISPWLALACRATTVVWVPLAPLFFLVPTGIDGMYERMLGLVTFVFVGAMGCTLIGRARAIAGD